MSTALPYDVALSSLLEESDWLRAMAPADLLAALTDGRFEAFVKLPLRITVGLHLHPQYWLSVNPEDFARKPLAEDRPPKALPKHEAILMCLRAIKRKKIACDRCTYEGEPVLEINPDEPNPYFKPRKSHRWPYPSEMRTPLSNELALNSALLNHTFELRVYADEEVTKELGKGTLGISPRERGRPTKYNWDLVHERLVQGFLTGTIKSDAKASALRKAIGADKLGIELRTFESHLKKLRGGG